MLQWPGGSGRSGANYIVVIEPPSCFYFCAPWSVPSQDKSAPSRLCAAPVSVLCTARRVLVLCTTTQSYWFYYSVCAGMRVRRLLRNRKECVPGSRFAAAVSWTDRPRSSSSLHGRMVAWSHGRMRGAIHGDASKNASRPREPTLHIGRLRVPLALVVLPLHSPRHAHQIECSFGRASRKRHR